MTSILVDARLSWASGIGRYVANTLPRVARNLPDCSFEVLYERAEENRVRAAIAASPNVIATPNDTPVFTLPEQWRIGRAARRHDITWFTNYWVPLAFRRPFIAAVHDMIHLEPSLFPASRVKRALSRRTFAHVAAHARGIAFGSRFTRREFERRFGHAPHGIVTGYGIDHDGWQSERSACLREKQRRILLVASAKAHKNFDTAIAAFHRARIENDWRLTLVVPEQKLRSSIDLMALGAGRDRIDVGYGLSDAQLQDRYAEAAIVLMPSRYEGFGLPLAEGLQAGARCISSTARSLVELGYGAEVGWVNDDDVDGWVLALERECAAFDARGMDPAVQTRNMAVVAEYKWNQVADRTATLISMSLG